MNLERKKGRGQLEAQVKDQALPEPVRRALGRAMWERARKLQFQTQADLALAAGASLRTVQGLLNGSSAHLPAPRTLKALEVALALDATTLVTAFQDGDPGPITRQPLDGTHPSAWMLQLLHTRGAITDPEELRAIATRLAPDLPGAARVLAVVADMADSGKAAGLVLTELAGAAGDENAPRRVAAARSRRRRIATAAANPQLPLTALA